MPNKTQFIGRWVNWVDTLRIEQELFANERFEGTIFDEEYGAVFGRAKGTWQLLGKAIHWRYTWSRDVPVPKKVEINPVVRVDDHHFCVRETDRTLSAWYRLVKSAETSTNFDYEQLEPFLKGIARFIDSGFGRTEVVALMKKVRRLKPDQTWQSVFLIKIKRAVAPFRIRVFMDDVDAPDVYFYAPTKLIRQIDNEIKKLDHG